MLTPPPVPNARDDVRRAQSSGLLYCPHALTQSIMELELRATIWRFPKIGGTLFWGPYHKDPTI